MEPDSRGNLRAHGQGRAGDRVRGDKRSQRSQADVRSQIFF